MLFNSYIFILVFLPIVFVTYYSLLKLKNKNVAKIFFIVANLYFYSYWNIKYLPIILLSIAFNFTMATAINNSNSQKKKKTLLVIGILANIALLGYYKYYDFFITNINTVFSSEIGLLNLALPLAISFFTFQQIAYLVDTYREGTKEYKLLDYAFFVTFFPHLIAGPIVHHREIIDQLHDGTNYRIKSANISSGLYIFAIGLFKKVIIADTFAEWANLGYNNIQSLTLVDSWITTLAYTIQLYFDFSGYCDMAIGLGLLFNIVLPTNFNSPYKALDIQDFWRRWHMTLGRFFTHYLYIPLGGNRKGKVMTYFNLFIVFFVSGIWHGAGWTFVVWGTLHGLAIVIHRFWKSLGFTMPKLLAWLVTFLFVHIAWVFFRSPDLSTANTMLHKMFDIGNFTFPSRVALILNEWLGRSFYPATYFFDLKLVVPFAIAFCIIMFFKNSVEKLSTFTPTYKNAAFISLLTVVALIYLTRVSEFLYFKF
ncbi:MULTISPECIES: MBOAT family protein [unclassified Bacillus (in: firmicutes)]|uniref:MBOAT family O-acyltransferase n=1 Tax=unclassified Bacillus (in: firmicutes) TaxID=185979 RepID=UPI0008EA0106|nr:MULTISPECIES: MBOAT family O-acyltransferase [unclassified Bacillus (in: firmicutes)]SFB25421.1 alginate O-acetyltransferase complex protein AlgI [Bacillus sp. UNCCL13]SFQ91742.1 alginate O-acetyltransferase complex protein AlgI [Bacillus sp. cl95]